MTTTTQETEADRHAEKACTTSSGKKFCTICTKGCSYAAWPCRVWLAEHPEGEDTS